MHYRCRNCGHHLGEYSDANGRAALDLPGLMDVQIVVGKCVNCGERVEFRRTDQTFARLMARIKLSQKSNNGVSWS